MEKHKNLLTDENGFTLIEIISVLIILSVLAATAVPRYIDLEENAKNRAIDAGIGELNVREKLTWANVLLSDGGYKGDDTVAGNLFSKMDFDLGDYYVWVDAPASFNLSPPTKTGGILKFKSMNTGVRLRRLPSTPIQPATWMRE